MDTRKQFKQNGYGSSRFWDRMVSGGVPTTVALITIFMLILMIGARVDEIDEQRDAEQAQSLLSQRDERAHTDIEWEARVVAAYQQGVQQGHAEAIASSASAAHRLEY